MQDVSRRTFLEKLGLGVGLSTAAFALPSFLSNAAKKPPIAEGDKLNVALVGLGNYSNILARALETSQYCRLAGIVTGTPAKAEDWSKKYNIPKKNIYNYQNFDTIKDNKDIDLVYVVLPNSMHAEFTIRAARAGKHVICEKPMAVSVQECEEMIKACKDAGVQLAIGYRLHYEPFNLEIKRLGQEKVFGPVRFIEAANGFRAGNANMWRLKKELSGGGPLMDMGVYCLQATRYVLGEEPISVTAQFGPVTRKELFSEVEESVLWQLEFPGGAIASSFTSYNTNVGRFYAAAEKGFFELNPAYGYGPLKGRTSNGELNLPIVNHQTAQMDGIGKVLLDKQALPDHISGAEGLRDVRIMLAIYEAARTGKKIAL
ncbi:MAG: Gfo/Idh/MocA family protein [Saprospiraceae bacterium]